MKNISEAHRCTPHDAKHLQDDRENHQQWLPQLLHPWRSALAAWTLVLWDPGHERIDSPIWEKQHCKVESSMHLESFWKCLASCGIALSMSSAIFMLPKSRSSRGVSSVVRSWLSSLVRSYRQLLAVCILWPRSWKWGVRARTLFFTGPFLKRHRFEPLEMTKWS